MIIVLILATKVACELCTSTCSSKPSVPFECLPCRLHQRGGINCNFCLYLDQILFTSVVDIICEEEEGNGDDELTTELVTEEDEILTVCQTLRVL